MSVEQQLSTLRRWLTALTVVTVFLAIAVFVLSSTRFEHIRAHRIELVNSQGKTAAVLGVSPSDGGVLLIYDANGTLRTAVGMTTRGNAAINLNDANGNQWVTIQVSSDGTVTMKGLNRQQPTPPYTPTYIAARWWSCQRVFVFATALRNSK
jgi:hypothetical protein